MVSSKIQHAEELTFRFPSPDSDRRLKEMILYVSEKCVDDPNFGAVKLNKILFFADFFSYAYRGRPITGAEYVKRSYGPCPKAILPIRKQMEESKEIVVKEQEFFGKVQHRVIPLRQPDLSLFKPEDIALVDRVIETLSGQNAKRVSDISHGRAWKAAEEGESIPYQAVFISDDPLDESDVERAVQMARERGWDV